jgi:hypothetical protein
VNRRLTMHKIVIFTDRPEECETLISCLKILFPECEVQVQAKQADKLQRASLASEPSTSKKKWQKAVSNGKGAVINDQWGSDKGDNNGIKLQNLFSSN